MSLLAMGPGAAAAITLRASLVISEALSTACTAVSCSSSPSTDANQRRTLLTSSSWVSPSKLKEGISAQATCDERKKIVQDARRRAPDRLVGDVEEVHRTLAHAGDVPALLVIHVGPHQLG